MSGVPVKDARGTGVQLYGRSVDLFAEKTSNNLFRSIGFAAEKVWKDFRAALPEVKYGGPRHVSGMCLEPGDVDEFSRGVNRRYEPEGSQWGDGSFVLRPAGVKHGIVVYLDCRAETSDGSDAGPDSEEKFVFGATMKFESDSSDRLTSVLLGYVEADDVKTLAKKSAPLLALMDIRVLGALSNATPDRILYYDDYAGKNRYLEVD